LATPPLPLVGDAAQPRRPLRNRGRLPEVVDQDLNRFRGVRLLPEISQLRDHPEKNAINTISINNDLIVPDLSELEFFELVV